MLRRLSVAMFLAALCGFVAIAGEEAPMPRVAGMKVATAPDAGKKSDLAIIEEIKTNREVMKNLQHLSDVIGPRLTGSANLEKANKWTAEVMKSYGLVNVHLEPWEIPVGWQRGTATMTMIEPNPGRSLLVASRGWTPGTKGKIRGPVVYLDVKTKADLEKYRGKLKNAIIMRSPPANVAPITNLSYGPSAGLAKKEDAPKKADEPKKEEPKKDEAKKDDQPPARPNFQDMMALRRELDEILKSEGVAAVITDSNKPHGLLVTTGSWREGDRGTPQDPLASLFMTHEHYALLHRLATDKNGTPPMVELEVTNTFVPGPITVYNTVGEIRGSEKPDEIVVVGAHLDSWDLATGTTDNGTGSCVTLEIARTLAKLAKAGYPPKRTIRFVLFSGEEQGLYGSKRYCEKHKDELAKHSVALVHDAGTGFVFGFALQGREAVRKVLEPELDSLKLIEGWRGLDIGGSGGTDHLSYEAAGVPGFACRQDSDEYRLTHHTQSDTFDKAKEPNLIQGASIIAITAKRIADLPELLPRDKPSAKDRRKENE